MTVTLQELTNFFRNKKVLVTGGTGSIGQQVVMQLLRYQPKMIVIFNKDDSKQYLMKQKLKDHSNLIYCLGDIRDYSSIEYAARGVDIVIHTAALKQVPICEDNPIEAVKTNILGSENVIKASILNGVKKIVNISTDKAVNPFNAMGATKLVAEKLFHSANYHHTNQQTKACSIRFGNVIDSRGSVFPLFMEQARIGEPLTVTNTQMNRFFIPIDEAVDRVIKAAYYSNGGETFILKMNALRIVDLAEAVSDYFREYEKVVDMKITGTRPGEKIFEELLLSSEGDNTYEDKELFVILPHDAKKSYHHFQPTKISSYRSDTVAHISKNEIKLLLNKLYQMKSE